MAGKTPELCDKHSSERVALLCRSLPLLRQECRYVCMQTYRESAGREQNSANACRGKSSREFSCTSGSATKLPTTLPEVQQNSLESSREFCCTSKVVRSFVALRPLHADLSVRYADVSVRYTRTYPFVTRGPIRPLRGPIRPLHADLSVRYTRTSSVRYADLSVRYTRTYPFCPGSAPGHEAC